MNPIPQPGPEAKPRTSSNLLDISIRGALLIALAVLCYRAFSPFLSLMAWSIILAVTMYPLHQWLARAVGSRQWLASTILVIIGFLLLIIPTGLLLNSFADSVRNLVGAVQNNTLEIRGPPEGVARWPIVGNKVYDTWSKAHADLPGLVQSMQPKIGALAHKALAMVASIGGGLLLFLGSFIIAGILMAYGESGSRSSEAIFRRVAGLARGEALAKLSTATIRAVALGVIGVAFIQAILIGLALLLAGVPSAGLLSIIALLLGIAQVPALLITVPDNVLKPLMLGRGVAVPMPVTLFGALGGIASGGILGMFVGATVLALGYHIFKGWVATDGDDEPVPQSERIKQGDSGLKT